MIPAIGIMIGAYIFTRMISIIATPKDGVERGVTRFCAIMTLAVTVLCLMILILV